CLRLVEIVDDLRRILVLAERVLRLELDERAERVGRFLLEPDVVVGAAAQLVGLGEDLPPAGRQGSVTPQALEARNDLVEDDDRPALLRTVELRNGPYEQVFDGLHPAMTRIGSGGHR